MVTGKKDLQSKNRMHTSTRLFIAVSIFVTLYSLWLGGVLIICHRYLSTIYIYYFYFNLFEVQLQLAMWLLQSSDSYLSNNISLTFGML